jgi:hypothetical protein
MGASTGLEAMKRFCHSVLQAGMDDMVYMQLDGRMAEHMMQIDPEQPCVPCIWGRPVLYVEKAVYETLKAALLFLKQLSSQLPWSVGTNLDDP